MVLFMQFPKLFDWFLETILQGTTESSQTDGSAGQKLKERLGSIDLYGVEGAAPMDEEEVRALNSSPDHVSSQ